MTDADFLAYLGRHLPSVRVVMDRPEDTVGRRVWLSGLAFVDGVIREYRARALCPEPEWSQDCIDNIVASMRAWRERTEDEKVWRGADGEPDVPFRFVQWGRWVPEGD